MKHTNLLKSAGILAMAATFAGAAFAGPTNAAGFAAPAHRTASAGCPLQVNDTKSLGAINPKTHVATRVVTGSHFDGCTGRNLATMTCKDSSVSCAEMIRG
ncbi:MAG: hypothetical protein PHC88_04495 [Terrimicrobiaceae bacterium]|nr:hypothetical protein [Terrimicrobiaceae bacterium]